ncbi:hypothetical protein JG687_00009362 [Phytophthora cactorum]|uniref:START-like domain n=1 Tax=Phytophthora cactorum TaxID=29920 RepID=A0A8T1UEV4_9STRA|nr:hypothetical protein JG687_00009362 [Phytophthora cactorum]
MSSKLRFPLPKNYFGHIQVTVAQKLEYQDVVQCRLEALLDDEQHYIRRRANKLPCLPSADWKYVRSHEDLKIYRRRRRGRSLEEVPENEDFPEARQAVANGQPSIVATGSIAGTVENLLYGFADTNYEEMRTTTSFLDAGTDSAVLRVFELATTDDPLHFFGLKWLYNSSAPSIEPRDVCFLEAMGMQKDADDETYGYLVLHSVELPECPPFEAKVLRGKLLFSCIFRDTAPGIVDVVLRGVFDTSGELRRLSMPYASLMPYATAAFVGSLTKAVRCAEAKKLTLLARYNAVSGKNRDALNVDEENPKHGLCSVCIRRVGTGVLSCLRLRWCRICGIAVCSKCCVKGKRVFLGNLKPHSACVCCPNCAQEARQMTGMRPTEPEYAVVADYFMESLLLAEPQSEDTTLLSSPFEWTAPPKSCNVAFDDWKKHRPGPILTLAEFNSSLNRTMNSSFDESSASVDDSSKDGIMELSDGDADRFRLTSSADEADGHYVFYSPESSRSLHDNKLEPCSSTTNPKTQECRDLVRQRLDAALSDDKCCNDRLANGLPSLNPRDWKSVRSFDGLQLFRCRPRGRSIAQLAAEEDFPQAVEAVTSGQPSVVAIGNAPGSIEDVLYGFAGTTDEETCTTLLFLLKRKQTLRFCTTLS